MATSGIRSEPFRWAIVAAAAVVGLLHVLGALQMREQVYRGYRSGDDRVIIAVIQGGPADRAGLKVGDRLRRIDGIDAGDTKALEARPRARVGQTQSTVIDRGVVSAAQLTAAVVQHGEPGGAAALMTTLSLVVVLLYFLLAVAALVQSCVRALPAERASSGLNVLVVCIVLGLAPMIPTAVYLVAPGVVFPGSEYYDLTWVLIPFALARATILQARNSSTAPGRA